MNMLVLDCRILRSSIWARCYNLQASLIHYKNTEYAEICGDTMHSEMWHRKRAHRAQSKGNSIRAHFQAQPWIGISFCFLINLTSIQMRLDRS